MVSWVATYIPSGANGLTEKITQLPDNIGQISELENLFIEKHNLKLGIKSYIPFLNSDLKKAFNSFEILYSDYEMQMKEKGEI